MKSNDFALTLNQKFFGIEFNRFVKIVTWLRHHEYCGQRLYPDARKNASDVTPAQVAHLIRALALNFNPFNSDINRQIVQGHCLRNETGDYYTDAVVRLLENGGALISETGLQRISYSQDRDSIVFVYRKPFFHEALQLHPEVTNFVAAENDVVYGDQGALASERFSMVKVSALKEIASMLSGVTEPKTA